MVHLSTPPQTNTLPYFMLLEVRNDPADAPLTVPGYLFSFLWDVVIYRCLYLMSLEPVYGENYVYGELSSTLYPIRKGS
jgi:hypothetical protein